MKKSLGLLAFLLFCCFSSLARATGPVDSCSLVTTEELAQILQAKVGPPVAVAAPRPHCTFSVQGKGMLQSVAVWAYHESAKIAFENGKVGLAPIQAVPGLGDEAYWGTNLMNVMKGNIYLQIQLIFPRVPNAFQMSRQIAEKAVGRL